MFPDISEFNGAVDWNALGTAFAAGQIEAVSMRAGFGTVRADLQFARNQAECRARGIPAIFYWFNYPTFNTPQAEAAMFASVVGPLRSGEAMMADFEDDRPASIFPRGQAGVQWARAFLSALPTPQNATWWYTYPSLFYEVGFAPLLGAWPFVLADYRAATDPGLTAAAFALQFTDCGSTPGVVGCCDQNTVLKPPLSQWLTAGAPASATGGHSMGALIYAPAVVKSSRADLFYVDPTGHVAYVFSDGGAGGLDALPAGSGAQLDAAGTPEGGFTTAGLSAVWDDLQRRNVIAQDKAGNVYLAVVNLDGSLAQGWQKLNVSAQPVPSTPPAAFVPHHHGTDTGSPA